MKTITILSILLIRFEAVLNAQSPPTFTISTVAGNGTVGFSGDGGSATVASFDTPLGVTMDAAGNLYVADFNNNRVRKISPDGTINTVAGTGVAGFGGDNGPALKALLYKPTRVTSDAAGNLFIADQFNNRIRKVTTAGIITTVAGSPQQGYCGDGGPATSACLNGPLDVALDAAGDFYIAEFGSHVIRKVDTKGTITTVVGNGIQGYSGDGGAPTRASLNNPGCVVVTALGDLLIADAGNARIRKVNNGVITTIIGSGTAGYSGDGGAATSAQISHSACIRLDMAGNYFIPDPGNNHVRIVLNGTISTIAGNGVATYTGDGGAATAAGIKVDTVAVASSGSIYASDGFNERILRLTPSSTNAPTITANGTVPIYSSVNTIQPGSWISIYGTNLATGTATWNGDFPTVSRGNQRHHKW